MAVVDQQHWSGTLYEVDADSQQDDAENMWNQNYPI